MPVTERICDRTGSNDRLAGSASPTEQTAAWLASRRRGSDGIRINQEHWIREDCGVAVRAGLDLGMRRRLAHLHASDGLAPRSDATGAHVLL